MRFVIYPSLLFAATILGGCRGDNAAMSVESFEFIVEEVFYIKPPVDRVILVGTIMEGKVQLGDRAAVHCKGGPITVVVESIDSIQQGAINEATKGDQVGLKLQGLKRDQPSRGDRVVGKERN